MQKIQNDRSFCIFCIYFLFAAVEGLLFNPKYPEISGKYFVLVLISLLFYFFSSLGRGYQSAVFLHSVYNTSASGTEQTTETNNSN